MWAIHDVDKTRLLLESGAQTEARGDDGRTALLIAASRAGSAPVVTRLLDHGARANVVAANRTTALRAIPGLSGKSTRVEYRLAGADANPYLAVAAGLASGLYGVERRVDPPPPFSGDAYAAPEGAVRPLPRSLEEATEALRSSRAARDLFGDAFVDHFAMTREWEARQFRKAVTDWELQRYFEVI